MTEPASCVDTSSRLRGLGLPMTKFGRVIQVPFFDPGCSNTTIPLVSRSVPIAIPRPRAGRDPHGAVTGRIVADTAWAPAVIDDRDIQTIIGQTSRMDGRPVRIVRR